MAQPETAGLTSLSVAAVRTDSGPLHASALSEWRSHWTLVLAALIGGSFAAVSVNSMALFIDPLRAEFGWSRTQITIGLAMQGFVVTPLAPFAGAVIDRFGPRRTAIGGLGFAILLFASFGLTTGSPTLWVVQWGFYALAALWLKITVWTSAVSRAFDRSRGMALAITLCGTALSQTLSPLLAYWLIQVGGWRYAYMALAFGWGGLALITALLFFRVKEGTALANGRAAIVRTGEGLSVRDALKSVKLYRIALSLLIGTILSTAVVTHKISILNEMGMSRWVAAEIAATAGAAGIAGKLITGWLCDRSGSKMLGVLSSGLSAVGFLLLLVPFRTPTLIVVAMIVLGLGSGATLQAAVYMTSRYAGMRNFGKIFGTVGSVTVFGVGLGPLLSSAIVDHFHSYQPLLILGLPASIVAALLMFGLGPYPDWRSAAVSAVDPA